MKKLSESRGPSIDMEKCVEQAGNNRFNLVIIAAQRLRELRRNNKNPEINVGSVNALIDVQAGLVNPVEYLEKIRVRQNEKKKSPYR